METQLFAGDEILYPHGAPREYCAGKLLRKKRVHILKVVPVLDSGDLDMEATSLLSNKTKLVSIVHISNSRLNKSGEIIEQAHARHSRITRRMPIRAPLLVEYGRTRLRLLCFFTHKVFASTGYGVLRGNEWLEKLPPISGGDMIERVDFDGTTYKGILVNLKRHPTHRGDQSFCASTMYGV